MFGCEIIIEKIDRVDLLVVLMYLVMAVRPRGFPCASHPSDHFPPLHLLAIPRFHSYHMPVKGFITITVVDHHVIPISIAGISRGAAKSSP